MLKAFNFSGNFKKNVFYFLIIVIIKFIVLYCSLVFHFDKHYTTKNFGGDAFDYVRYAQQLAETGVYRLPGTIDGVTEFVYRMPGMSFVLAPLMYVFGFSAAIKMFVVFQVLLSAYAGLLLFNLLKSKINNKYINLLLFIFISFGIYFNRYTSFVLSETLAQSLFIILSCYFIETKKQASKLSVMLMACLFTWMFFLRPFMIVFFPLFCLRLFDFTTLNFGLVKAIKLNASAFLFAGLIIGFTSIWTIRNYVKTEKLVVMEYSVKPEKIKFMKECIPQMYDYIRHFGGNQYVTLFDKETSHLLWFYPERSLIKNGFKRPSDKIFPSVVFSDGITIDSLVNIRNLLDSTILKKEGSIERKKYFALYSEALTRADDAVLKNTDIFFHLKNRKDALVRFFIQPIGNNKVFSKIPFLYPILINLNKILNYIFITLMIVLTCVFGIMHIRNYYFLILPAIFLLYFFIGYYNIKEERELFCFYPVFLIVGIEVLLKFKEVILRNRR